MGFSKQKRAEIEKRRTIVAANLLAGATYRAMSSALGVSLGTISKDVKIIFGRWRREQIQDVNEHARLDLQRLDIALNAVWDDVRAGNLPAIDRMLRISERRGHIIGFDAPQKIAPTDPSGEKEYGSLTDDQRSMRVVALLEIARARRDQPAPGDAGANGSGANAVGVDTPQPLDPG